MGQLFFGIIIFTVGGVLLWAGQHIATKGWDKWQNQRFSEVVQEDKIKTKNDKSSKVDVFGVNFIVTFNSTWPGPLVYIYPSALGKTVSPISVALYVEVVNKKDKIAHIYSYSCKALMRYDEGGTGQVITTPNGGQKFLYKPSGKITEKWRTLHSMGFVSDQVYYVPDNNLKKARRIDFSQNSFHRLANDKQLMPGESFMGWIFFELDPDLRGQLCEIKQIELSLTNSVGESQTFNNNQKPKDNKEMETYVSAGDWHILKGAYDLTKEKLTITPKIDLPGVLKKD